jgi:uncharacterized iron-regulated membrane protein
MHATVGDVIVIEGPVLDKPRRRGEVLDVVTTSGEERYRVRWEDGHESVFCPGPDAHIVERRES